MSFQVVQEVFLRHKVPGTEVALVTFVADVSVTVHDQVTLLCKGLAAVGKLVWAFTCVCSFMVLHIRCVIGSVATRNALPHTARPRTVEMRWSARAVKYGDQVFLCHSLHASTITQDVPAMASFQVLLKIVPP